MMNWRTIVLALSSLVYCFEPVDVNASDWITQSYTTVDGQPIDLRQSVGKKPVYLKFWASWCVPCNKQMPHFQKAYETLGDEIAFLSVNIDLNDDSAAVKQMMAKHELSMPTILDESGELSKRFDLIGTPLHVLLDRSGKVVHRGHDADAKLDKMLHQLASSEPMRLPEVFKQALSESGKGDLQLAQLRQGKTYVLFTATWCDWYLAKSRPQHSKNCIEGQKHFNRLNITDGQQLSLVSRLWTDEKALTEFRQKYRFEHPVHIDQSNSTFLKFNVKTLPTLIVLQDGKEIQRVEGKKIGAFRFEP